ncbi:MAG: hypothetical protein GX625_10575, partial [Clostridiaceae bacterium]|nr:hypothetical protein [Clostridiaceae bacterium]
MAVQGINLINSTIASPVKGINNLDESVNFKDILIDALNNVNTLEQE